MNSTLIEIAVDSFENKRFRISQVLYPYLKEQIKDDRMYYVLLDEVQLLGEFELILNSLIRMKNGDVGVIALNKTNEKGYGIRKQLEIDFVCTKGTKRYYVQSAYAVLNQTKMEQEQRSLMLTGDFFHKNYNHERRTCTVL